MPVCEKNKDKDVELWPRLGEPVISAGIRDLLISNSRHWPEQTWVALADTSLPWRVSSCSMGRGLRASHLCFVSSNPQSADHKQVRVGSGTCNSVLLMYGPSA